MPSANSSTPATTPTPPSADPSFSDLMQQLLAFGTRTFRYLVGVAKADLEKFGYVLGAGLLAGILLSYFTSIALLAAGFGLGYLTRAQRS